MTEANSVTDTPPIDAFRRVVIKGRGLTGWQYDLTNPLAFFGDREGFIFLEGVAMLQTQSAFCDYLDGIKAELDRTSALGVFEELGKNIQSAEELKRDIAEAELVVPVVGAFSSGKSTLINSFLGSDYLPVNITPETALATELRYSDSERVEAIMKNGESDRYAIAEIGAIKEKAAQYQYVEVFLNSEQLKGIAPLVLVDMPGFDSPLDLHHRAILTYLARGSHYAVLISVEEGTVTQSAHRQLSEFDEFDKPFSVFLSKANLRSESEVQEIAQNIQDRLEDDFDFADAVVPVGKDGGDSLDRMFRAIDPEELFARLYRPSLEGHFFDIDGSLNTWISSLKKDESENQEAIDELAAGIRDLEQKKDAMIRDVRSRYSTTRANDIVERVGADLNNAVEELTGIALSSGEDAFQRHMSEILRSSLVSHVKTEMEQLNRQIVEDLSRSVKGIDHILSSYTSNENWLEKTMYSAPQLLSVGSAILKGVGGAVKGGRNLYRVLTTTLAITTSFVMPILELFIIFLPDIIGYFQKRRQEEQIRNQLIGTVIPSIKSKLRSELPKDFEDQVNGLINENAVALDSQIKAKQSEIAEAEQAKKDALQDIGQTIADLTSIRENIRLLATPVLFAQQGERT